MNIPQPDALNSKHCDLVGPDAKKIDDLSDDLASVRTLVAKPDAKKIDELPEKIDDLPLDVGAIQWAHNNHTITSKQQDAWYSMCLVAARHGQVDVMQLDKDNQPSKNQFNDHEWCCGISVVAAQYGKLEIMEFLETQDFRFHKPNLGYDDGYKTYNVAAKYGQDHIVRWLKDRQILLPMELEWSRETRLRLIQKSEARGTVFMDYEPKHPNDAGYGSNPYTDFNRDKTGDKLTRLVMACEACVRLGQPPPKVMRLPPEVLRRALRPNYLSDNKEFVRTYDLGDL